MAFIDLLINETTEKFGLGSKGIGVISAIVSTMNQPLYGGMEGFLNRFRQAGMSNQVNAWLQNEIEPPLLPQHLEAALDLFTLQQIADKAKLTLSQTKEVVAFAIPLLICHLAARKTLFSTQPDAIRQALWSNQNEPPPITPDAPPFLINQLASSAKSQGLKLLRGFPFL